MSPDNIRTKSLTKLMHGRENADKSGKNNRSRMRLNVELSEENSQALEIALQEGRLTKVQWADKVVKASLGKRGFKKAGQELFQDRLFRERQEFLNGGLYVINLILKEPLLREPSAPLDQHVSAVLASATVAEIRAMLHGLVRHIARDDWSIPKAGGAGDKSQKGSQ